MLKVVLRFSTVLAVLFTCFFVTPSNMAAAQDYRYARQSPREMTYQAEPQRPRGFFESLFGGRDVEPSYAPPLREQFRGHLYQGSNQRNRDGVNINRQTGLPMDQNYIERNPRNNYVPKSTPRPTRTAATANTQLYCVRSCDGFFFPLSSLSGEAKDNLTQQEACSSLCPGSQTELYKMTSGTIETMVGPSRKAYSAHPKAFAFREKIEQTCSCKGVTTGGLARLPYTKDHTLRSGDLLVLETGAHIFDGGDDFPYKPADFKHASRSGRLSEDMKKLLVAKNILHTKSSTQVASRGNANDATSIAIELGEVGSAKNLRIIDILAKETQRPRLMIDLIESRRQNKVI